MGERALIPGYVKLPPSTVGIGGPLIPSFFSFSQVSWTFING